MFVAELKSILSAIRRNVKDRLECQGRHQVKVILTNLLSKCEYYLNEYDRKKLTLANTVFNSITSTTLIDNKNDLMNENDDEEPMSFSEISLPVNTSSFLPDLE